MTTAIETAEIEISEPNKFQVMPPLTDDDFAALKADIKANGLLIPVEVDEDGNVLDGHHRVRACTRAGDRVTGRREGARRPDRGREARATRSPSTSTVGTSPASRSAS